MAAVTRMCGDLEAAEDAVQDAFLLAVAVAGWPATGVPANLRSWLIGWRARWSGCSRSSRRPRDCSPCC
ncbi:MAG TPA: hypothetical protein VKV35_00870 [Streptosporangiaceae bacterium]|nr:hypothetical protein [Streptosporangiaceae bacterium]